MNLLNIVVQLVIKAKFNRLNFLWLGIELIQFAFVETSLANRFLTFIWRWGVVHRAEATFSRSWTAFFAISLLRFDVKVDYGVLDDSLDVLFEQVCIRLAF